MFGGSNLCLSLYKRAAEICLKRVAFDLFSTKEQLKYVGRE